MGLEILTELNSSYDFLKAESPSQSRTREIFIFHNTLAPDNPTEQPIKIPQPLHFNNIKKWREIRTKEKVNKNIKKIKTKKLPGHASAMKQTEKHMVAVPTVRSHNLRLMTMIDWVKEFF